MNIPGYLKEKLLFFYSEDVVNDIISNFEKDRITSLRVNTLKTTIEEVISVLDSNCIKFELVNEIPFALIVDCDEDSIKELDIYKNGDIYLQSLSSMLPPLFLDITEKSTILDMTAAPGGKTSEICALGNNNVFVTATELNKIRFDRLNYNLNKLGCKNVTVLKQDASKLDEYFSFNNILLDAPCSGSGTIEHGDYSKISLDLINNIPQVQYNLLKKAISLLDKGQTMVYSTCSILKDENENVVSRILSEYDVEIVPIDLDVEKLPSSLDGVITVKPTKYYEGFFVCKLKKN